MSSRAVNFGGVKTTPAKVQLVTRLTFFAFKRDTLKLCGKSIESYFKVQKEDKIIFGDRVSRFFEDRTKDLRT